METDKFIKRVCDGCTFKNACPQDANRSTCLEILCMRDGVDFVKANTDLLWVSVYEDLPHYDETVLVTSEEHPDEMWFCHRSNDKEHVETHEYDFCNYTGFQITHWMRINNIKSNELCSESQF